MSDQYKMCFAPIPMHPSYQSTRGLGFGPQNMNSTRKESYVVYRKKIDLRYNIYTSLYLTFVFKTLKPSMIEIETDVTAKEKYSRIEQTNAIERNNKKFGELDNIRRLY